MAQAARTKDIHEHKKALDRIRGDKALTNKTFEELSKAEKDALLKRVAIRLGMVKQS